MINPSRKKWLNAYRAARLEVRLEESSKKSKIELMTATEILQRPGGAFSGFGVPPDFITAMISQVIEQLNAPPPTMKDNRNKKAAGSWMVQFGPGELPPGPPPGEFKYVGEILPGETLEQAVKRLQRGDA